MCAYLNDEKVMSTNAETRDGKGAKLAAEYQHSLLELGNKDIKETSV